MTSSQIFSAKSGSERRNGKRNKASANGDYGGWSQSEHMKFIESKRDVKVECKKNFKQWKTIQSAFPDLSIEEIKSHANAFFGKINTIRPHKMSILDFMRKNPLEFFKDITFDDVNQRRVENRSGAQRRLILSAYEEEKQPVEDKVVEEVKAEQAKEHHMPTQSQVMIDALKATTAEMMKLMQSLVKDLQAHGEEIRKCPNAAGYWGYVYNSAVYLQQLVNDVTVAHNSTLSFMQ
eukprot:TRINITY_DN4493_c0_g2_i15.p1 TRINITY_DN4493_c0_g2~~TRINITY_DN4493_c0_g2_i15.p1  ORF type:complete len:235 (+),score=74.68 TRINITY_DN4493_c0_g2_i15:2731-3435(+)